MKIQFEGEVNEVLEAIAMMGASIAESGENECATCEFNGENGCELDEDTMNALADKYVAEAEQEVKESPRLRAIRELNHYSTTKQQFVKISEMNGIYIMNVLRTKLNEIPAKKLFDNLEFQSLILNLAEAVKTSIEATDEEAGMSDQEKLVRETVRTIRNLSGSH